MRNSPPSRPSCSRRRPSDSGTRTAALHVRYEALDGYTARSRAAQLAAGLGFDAADLSRPLREFSGGLRMRANLARALMRRSDLLLLDEPTNHLDLDALLWLEEWLRAYRGTLLLVSHDREFLDRTVDAHPAPRGGPAARLRRQLQRLRDPARRARGALGGTPGQASSARAAHMSASWRAFARRRARRARCKAASSGSRDGRIAEAHTECRL